MNKICVTIAETTIEAVLNKWHKLKSDGVEFVEIRLDYVDRLDETSLKQLFGHVDGEVIYTLRTKSEGGRFEGNLNQYQRIITRCLSKSKAYVDVELEMLATDESFVSQLPGDRIIVSYHNFQQTPDNEMLEAKLADMRRILPKSIAKLAVKAQSMQDVARLIELQKKQKPDSSVIVAMGEKGQILRLLGTFIGGFVTFASSENSPTVPGQMYYKTMQDLIRLMESK